jgi:NADPH-dependent 2,4-dienoyl-CoA reductase/sulfur reductase-like enzyme/nitrite reductase/ring-hydroxylating ferredoxin subunit
MSESLEISGPDFLNDGIACSALEEGKPVAGQANGEGVLIIRRGEVFFALGAACTHYGAPLADGIVEGDTIRCPWHHARFDLATGEASGPPALNAIPCFSVERRSDRVYVLGRAPEHSTAPGGNPRRSSANGPQSIAIVGGGPAGTAAAEMLRREGYDGPITLFASEPSSPVDRPNLSKDYLAGNASEDWIPLRSPKDFAQYHIDLRREVVRGIEGKTLILEDRSQAFDAILLTTGATPIRLDIPGAARAHLLRTLDDSRSIIAHAKGRAIVIGASFIGLEAAAALTTRGLEVHVIGRELVPLERVLGPELGTFVRQSHEKKGVQFHLGESPREIDAKGVVLEHGRIDGEIVIMGVGVRPETSLAEKGGLAIDRGIVVDDQFRTSIAGIWAAGDVARFPYAYTGEKVRIEHWVVAEQQGQAAARSMLGKGTRFDRVPFFWSAHYDTTIGYVGHAESWDRIDFSGDFSQGDAAVAYRRAGKTLAVAAIGRDQFLLHAEAAIERGDEMALIQMIPPSATHDGP